MYNQIVFNDVVTPLTDRKYSRIGDKRFTYKLKSVINGRIMLPYDGVIISTNKQDVNGYLLAKHRINGEIYYSEYTNIPKLIVSPGDVLSSGQIIGYYLNNDDEITYLLRNSRMYRVNSEPFFNNVDSGNKDDEKTDDEKTDDEKKETSYNSKKSKDDYEDDDDKGRKLNSNFTLLSPMFAAANKTADITDKISKSFSDAIKDTFTIKDKKKKKEEEDINENIIDYKLFEEVKRIKKLL